MGTDAVREAEIVGASLYWQEDDVPGVSDESFIKGHDDLKQLRLPDPLGNNRMHEQIKALMIPLQELGDDKVVFAWVEAPFQESAMLRNINYFVVDLYKNQSLYMT